MAFTPEQKRKYVDDPRCPYCGSDDYYEDFDYEPSTTFANQIQREMECDDCKKTLERTLYPR